jgi:hypothetical protein
MSSGCSGNDSGKLVTQPLHLEAQGEAPDLTAVPSQSQRRHLAAVSLPGSQLPLSYTVLPTMQQGMSQALQGQGEKRKQKLRGAPVPE